MTVSKGLRVAQHVLEAVREGSGPLLNPTTTTATATATTAAGSSTAVGLENGIWWLVGTRDVASGSCVAVTNASRCARYIQYPDVRVPVLSKELDVLSVCMADRASIVGVLISVPAHQEHLVSFQQEEEMGGTQSLRSIARSFLSRLEDHSNVRPIPATLSCIGIVSDRQKKPVFLSWSSLEPVGFETFDFDFGFSEREELVEPFTIKASVKYVHPEAASQDLAATLLMAFDQLVKSGIVLVDSLQVGATVDGRGFVDARSVPEAAMKTMLKKKKVFVNFSGVDFAEGERTLDLVFSCDEGSVVPVDYTIDRIPLTADGKSIDAAAIQHRIGKLALLDPSVITAGQDGTLVSIRDVWMHGWHFPSLLFKDEKLKKEIAPRLGFATVDPSVYDSTKLARVHAFVPSLIGSWEVATVAGNYLYYHYNHDAFNDKGWGCAYRSLQTLFSWFILNGFTDRTVPSLPEIQETLVAVGDKPKKFIGSREWIGAFEISVVLNQLLGLDSRIIRVESGKDLPSQYCALREHFVTVGTPVMFGGGQLAYTCLGVARDSVKGEVRFLILDPHYVGDDVPKAIVSKGWCNWKTVELFKADSFYNLCLPQKLYT
eukprot:ANDGO_08370.mRNA.1 Ufm1-specific protease